MQKNIHLRLLPSEAVDPAIIKQYIASTEAVRPTAITGYHIIKSSIDARGKQAWINLQVKAFINEPFHSREQINFQFQDVSNASQKSINSRCRTGRPVYCTKTYRSWDTTCASRTRKGYPVTQARPGPAE